MLNWFQERIYIFYSIFSTCIYFILHFSIFLAKTLSQHFIHFSDVFLIMINQQGKSKARSQFTIKFLSLSLPILIGCFRNNIPTLLFLLPCFFGSMCHPHSIGDIMDLTLLSLVPLIFCLTWGMAWPLLAQGSALIWYQRQKSTQKTQGPIQWHTNINRH